MKLKEIYENIDMLKIVDMNDVRSIEIDVSIPHAYEFAEWLKRQHRIDASVITDSYEDMSYVNGLPLHDDDRLQDIFNKLISDFYDHMGIKY